MKRATLVLLISALAGMSRAWANDPESCHAYADSAIQQMKTMAAMPECPRSPPVRWHYDWTVHYQWCLRVSPDDMENETRARIDQIDACAEHTP